MTQSGRDRDPRLETATRAETESGQEALRTLRAPALTVLSHPDLERVGERAPLSALAAGGDAPLSRLVPGFAHPGSAAVRPLQDTRLSRDSIRLLRAGDDGALRIDRGSCRTKIKIDGIPLETEATVARDAVGHGVVIELGKRVALLLHLARPVSAGGARHGLVGESDAVVGLRQQIDMVAGLDLTVLLRGESGTGKELVARALHNASARRDGPLVAVNMAAIPPSLAAAELFGAAKGAFTGANRTKAGFFARAQGGTLFLDEVGETPLDVQALLLRALETHEIQPVGGGDTRPVDVRVIAATDSDLERAIEDGRVRAPLFHRLAGYQIELPPLRERRDDIGRLFVHFLREAARNASSPTAADARPKVRAAIISRMARYSWPGNVRQLKNAAQRLAIAQIASADLDEVLDDVLRETDGDEPRRGPDPRGAPASRAVSEPRRRYRDPATVDEDELLEALDREGWRIQPTARALGVSRGTLYRLIESCPRIRKAVDLDRAEIESALAAANGDLARAAAALQVSPQGLKRRATALGLTTDS